MKLPIIDVKADKHTLEIRAHVVDIGKKCLVNMAGLAHKGCIFAHGGDDKALDLVMAPNKAVFALCQGKCGMPILPTKDAPIKASSAPAGLMARMVGMMREGSVRGHPPGFGP